MKFSTMRNLERHAGFMLVFLLNALKFLGFPYRRRVKTVRDHPVKNILILKFFGLGSIINSFPLLDVLRKDFPDAKIIFATFESNRGFFDITKKADEILTVRPDNIPGFGADSIKLLLKLWARKIDVCIDLEFFSKYTMSMSFLSRAAVRVGFFARYNIRSSLLTHPTSFNHYKHISRAYLSMAEAMGLDVPDKEYSIELPEHGRKEHDRVNKLIGNGKQRPIVTINPNASSLCTLRRWPAAHYEELLRTLLREYPDYHYVLIGSKSENEYVQSICDSCGTGLENLVNAAGQTSIGDLMVLLEMSELLVSNDSGPVHLAACYQTNTLVLYGPETPMLYRPLNPNARVLYKGLYCSPCINVLDNKSFEECTAIRCMHMISVEEVMNELKEHFLKK